MWFGFLFVFFLGGGGRYLSVQPGSKIARTASFILHIYMYYTQIFVHVYPFLKDRSCVEAAYMSGSKDLILIV